MLQTRQSADFIKRFFWRLSASEAGKQTVPREKKQQDSGNSGSWITTFTNLVLLLLAFFVVLVVLSEPREEKFMAGMSSLFGAFGIPPHGVSTIGSDKFSDITGDGPPIMKAQDIQESLQQVLAANGLLSDAEVKREGSLVILSLSDRLLFEFGSSRLHADAGAFLQDISEVIKREKGKVELRGYADHSESVFAQDPVLSAYDLSIRRALAVDRFLAEQGRINQERIVAHGFGVRSGRKPLSNKEASWGTQVEIILDYNIQLPYRIRAEDGRSPFLEYKGFLFRRLGG